jgi:hypothetical protein
MEGVLPVSRSYHARTFPWQISRSDFAATEQCPLDRIQHGIEILAYILGEEAQAPLPKLLVAPQRRQASAASEGLEFRPAKAYISSRYLEIFWRRVDAGGQGGTRDCE